jgi:murein DD-endopeptidase MepM/ murein hydrolase activator NlpD
MGRRALIPAVAAIAVAGVALLGPGPAGAAQQGWNAAEAKPAKAAKAAAASPGPVARAPKQRRRYRFGQRVLRVGMRGKDVRVLQKFLTKLDFTTPIDGAFGKLTRKSVSKLETRKGWRVDGKVSRKDAKRIRGLLAKPTSGIYYAYGLTRPTVTLTSQKAGEASVEVVGPDGVPVAAIAVSFNGAEEQTVSWNGVTSSGASGSDTTYTLVLGGGNTAHAIISGGQARPFVFRQRAFPVPGAHDYGGAGSRFGAPRGDHLHQGQDLAASCGERLQVAEGGILRVNSYQAGGAGYYVVIDGGISGTDYVYMHMSKASWAAPGQIVYTGQTIGKVGNTGSSSGCHLHFEHWTAPGWYLGGYPYDPFFELKYWDTYS